MSEEQPTTTTTTERALELEAEERRWQRAERLACIVALLAGSIVAHVLGAPDALVYNLSGGALTLLFPAGSSNLRRIPVALLVGTSAGAAATLAHGWT